MGGQPGSKSRNSCPRSQRAFCASMPSPSSVRAACKIRRYRFGHWDQGAAPFSSSLIRADSQTSVCRSVSTVVRYSANAPASSEAGVTDPDSMARCAGVRRSRESTLAITDL
jgi:hypothetical protein